MSDAATESVARFAADWEASLRGTRAEPPRLSHYVPDGSAVRLSVLADLVRIDMRQRWQRPGAPGRRMVDYAREFPELAGGPRFVELVCEEYAVRQQYRRIAVSEFVGEYAPEFPELAVRLRTLLNGRDDPPPAEGDPADPAAVGILPADVEIGATLDDFDLLTVLGGDESAKVFLARQRSMQRLVAVRVEVGAGHDAHTVAQLDHRYIVRVFDQRLVPARARQILRLQYMQYMPGGSGDDLIRLRRTATTLDGSLLLRSVDAAMAAKGEIRLADSSVRAELSALSWPEAVAWLGRRLATALDYADHQGLAHRAIQPSNVLFTAEGVPQLADFSLRSPNTAAAQRIRWSYWSPEQLAALHDPDAPEPDARGDIYSLAVLLWEILTGTNPFDDTPAVSDDAGRDEAVALLLRRRRAGVGAGAIARLPPDTPATLRRVLLECLDPDPARRRRSGADLAGQLELCLDPRARDLVDPPPNSPRRRTRGWLAPIAVICVALPNLLASLYNIRLNKVLIIDGLSAAAQARFATVVAINNVATFTVAGVLILVLCRGPFVAAYRLARAGPSREFIADPARLRAQTLTIADRLVWVPFVLWLVAGIVWPSALMWSGVVLPSHGVLQFYAAQAVCAAIALAYPFFLVSVYVVRSVYPQLLVMGGAGPSDGRQLQRLQRRSTVYLAVAAAVPLVGVVSVTFVPTWQLAQVIVALRVLSVGGIAAFVLTYWLFRLLEADVRALRGWCVDGVDGGHSR
ncbi:protein kinase domain-containing protein [Nocardia alni]|uniref:protein kinase domain-containing protein n=1 Tax=Nocardia alni TaxID=2815723 RepID=UPI001C231B06|nr:protein kinase [Nocardia alni]